jgi:hypothetical protein
MLTMIPPETWTTNVRSVVELISDEQAQRTAWLGPEPSIVWCPDELFAKFFDDLFFDEFLVSPEVNLTDRQRAAGRDLEAQMTAFSDSAPAHPEPGTIVGDERWRDIRKAAKAFPDTLG